MKVAIMGAGGVGGYYGVRLAKAGHDVSFIARGAHGRAIAEQGLRVESPLGSTVLMPAKVFEQPKDIGRADLVLVAVKLWDALSAARAILPMVDDTTVVVSLQNGIDKDEILGGEVGRQHLLGGVTYINALISAPGTVKQIGSLQRVVLGEFDGRHSQRCEAIVSAFLAAGIDCELSTNIQRAIWEKFIFLTAYSGLTAVVRLPIGPIRSHPVTRKMLEDAMRDGVAVAMAAGVAIGEDFISRQLSFIDALPADARASMAVDLQRGNRLELEWLSGAIVRWAERSGVSVPVQSVINAALIVHAGGSKALPSLPDS